MAALRVSLCLFLLLLLVACTTSVRVEWSAESELNTAGFNLYRGDAASGPFPVQVNPQLIPAAADPMAGGNYSYTDLTAQAGHTYYYERQEVEQNGAINHFGPIAAQASWLDWPVAAGLAVLIVLAALLWFRRSPKPEANSPPPATDART
jgi:hypothetical protein